MAVLETVIQAKQSSKYHPRRSPIAFIKAGEKPNTPLPFTIPTLHSTRLAAKVDLGRQDEFHDHFSQTTPHPDVVILSNSTRLEARGADFIQIGVDGKGSQEEALKIQGVGRVVQGTRLTSLLGQLLQGVGPVKLSEGRKLPGG